MFLADVTVVDLTSGLAGSVAARLLADAGARVIKIEPPTGAADRDSAAFATWNRGKLSVSLAIDGAEGRDQLDRLLGTADVLVHELLPREARELGLDAADVQAAHPQLIVATVTPYPAGHPDADRFGDDLLVQARSGMSAEQGCARPGPTFIRLPAPSWSAAYLTCAGILCRLLVRDRTGMAGPVRSSLLQGALSCLTLIWHQMDSPSPRMAAKLPLPKRPSANTFHCSDDVWIQTAAGYWQVPLMIETLATLGIEPPEEQPDPGPAFAAVYQLAFDTRPSAEWIEALRQSDVATEAIVSIGDPLRDPQAIANGYTVDLEDPRWGRCRQAGVPIHCEPALSSDTPAPRLGQHNDLLTTLFDSTDDASRGSGPPPTPQGAAGTYPLEGLRVLDLGMFVGGPLAPALLADLGAEVIKLEPPTGDRMRLDELMFVAAGRGKRSISVDLKRPAGREILRRLIEWADVVHHNVRSDAAVRLGIDAESVAAINPRAVFCHVSAFGPQGEKRRYSSYDPQMQAVSGWMSTCAGPGNRPVWLRFAPTDVHCAQLSLIATLMALYLRERSGVGSAVATSMLGGSLMTNSETLLLLDTDELTPVAQMDALTTGTRPGYRLYETANGWIAVSIPAARESEILHKAFGTDNGTAIAERLRALDTEPACAMLAQLGVGVEQVRIDHELQFLTDLDNLRAGLVVQHQHPVYGRIAQVGAFWDFGDLRLSFAAPPPTLGQHTREVLLQLGFSRHEVLEFAASGSAFGDALA
jgi:crotonobetainyl-CoA:carnitine CoA-transferase CaiB-like acyl-CoA transferase